MTLFEWIKKYGKSAKPCFKGILYSIFSTKKINPNMKEVWRKMLECDSNGFIYFVFAYSLDEIDKGQKRTIIENMIYLKKYTNIKNFKYSFIKKCIFKDFNPFLGV